MAPLGPRRRATLTTSEPFVVDDRNEHGPEAASPKSELGKG